MGLRDKLKDTLRRAVAPKPATPSAAPPPPFRPVPRYRDAMSEVREAIRVEPLAPPVVEEAPPPPPVVVEEPKATTFRVRLLNEAEALDVTLELSPDELILEASERAGLALPYSCRNGGCTSCTGRLVSGEVEMDEQYTLEPENVAEGFRLLCCARARSDVVLLTHQAESLP